MMLLSAMRMIPGNEQLERRVEYVGAVKFYFGQKAAGLFQVLLHISLQSLNIASIIDVACTFDRLIAAFFGRTFAFQFYPWGDNPNFDLKWVAGMYDTSNGEFLLAITAGYAMVGLLCVPMGVFNIDDNIIVQVFSFIFLVLLLT